MSAKGAKDENVKLIMPVRLSFTCVADQITRESLFLIS